MPVVLLFVLLPQNPLIALLSLSPVSALALVSAQRYGTPVR
jgi:hypothetical protein